MESCETCRFWQKGTRGVLDGPCRRYPPNGCGTLMPTQRANSIAQPGKQQMELRTLEYTVCPRTNKDFWCGEYDAK